MKEASTVFRNAGASSIARSPRDKQADKRREREAMGLRLAFSLRAAFIVRSDRMWECDFIRIADPSSPAVPHSSRALRPIAFPLDRAGSTSRLFLIV